VAPELVNLRIDLEDFRTNYLNDILVDKSLYKSFEYKLLYYALYWEIIKDDLNFPADNQLPDPYIPILILIQRGNHIYRGEVSTIEVDNLAIKNEIDFSLPSLDIAFLDFIDSSCQRMGSDGIPNKQRVDALWAEYNRKK
jgi:hypothetical protein